MTTKRFNIRIYGLWVEQGRVWVNEERIYDRHILKFPGGGLEYGEGTIDCLKREWMEEFGVAIEVLGHFYTTDFFQPSFFDDSQVVSIYYLVKPLDSLSVLVNKLPQDRGRWLDIADIDQDTFPLPIDAHVGDMLQLVASRE